VRIMLACRLRNACKDNVSCLTGKGNKRAAPQFREFMEPVITEMDPEECVEEQYKVRVPLLLLMQASSHLVFKMSIHLPWSLPSQR
jgi:hypothetical protein